MRVLFLVGNLGAGGLERFVTRVSIRAVESGDFEPIIMCLGERSGLFVDSLERVEVPVLAAPAQWRKGWPASEEMVRILKSQSVDIIHSQVNFSLWQQFTTAKRARVNRFCVTERNCYDLRGFARLRRAIQFHLLRSSGAKYTANSEAVARHLARMVFVDSDSIEVLPNGVPIPDVSPETRRAIRSRLGWSDEVFGVGYVSRMAEHKGHTHFLRALAQARRACGDIRACLVGDGPQRSVIEKEISTLGLDDAVTLTGTVSNVEDYMQGFDLVALLSTREGMANAILEAMAAGTAVMATGVGGNTELLDEGNAGILLPDSSASNVVAGLIRMKECPDIRADFGARARQRAEQIYSLEACYKRLVAHYAEVARH